MFGCNAVAIVATPTVAIVAMPMGPLISTCTQAATLLPSPQPVHSQLSAAQATAWPHAPSPPQGWQPPTLVSESPPYSSANHTCCFPPPFPCSYCHCYAPSACGAGNLHNWLHTHRTLAYTMAPCTKPHRFIGTWRQQAHHTTKAARTGATMEATPARYKPGRPSVQVCKPPGQVCRANRPAT